LYPTGRLRITYRDAEVRPDATVIPVGEEKTFAVEQAEQIANFADYCNYCGNCDTFCPEYDGPYLKKPNFFGSRQAFDAAAPRDGFLLEPHSKSILLRCRIEGQTYLLEQLADGSCQYNDGSVIVNVASDNPTTLTLQLPAPAMTHVVDIGRFLAIRTLLRGITDSTRVHAVNTPILGESAIVGR
jgi:hypothetical protein